MLIRMGRTLSTDVRVWVCVKVYFFANVKDLMAFLIVSSGHGLTYRMHRPVQRTVQQVWHCMKGCVN